jgi:hypothetical protein
VVALPWFGTPSPESLLEDRFTERRKITACLYETLYERLYPRFNASQFFYSYNLTTQALERLIQLYNTRKNLLGEEEICRIYIAFRTLYEDWLGMVLAIDGGDNSISNQLYRMVIKNVPWYFGKSLKNKIFSAALSGKKPEDPKVASYMEKLNNNPDEKMQRVKEAIEELQYFREIKKETHQISKYFYEFMRELEKAAGPEKILSLVRDWRVNPNDKRFLIYVENFLENTKR